MSRKIISRTVLILSLVSLFTDTASEMLYPVMPLYLQSIGFTIVSIGILEGVAEAIAGLSKGYFGKMSDSLGRRLPFVQFGYALSAISKPMMGTFTSIWGIFTARAVDRIGKGIRTAPRDALLSDEATETTKGTVFGFHRSLDTMGAALGPLIALLFLYYYPNNYRQLFFLAFIPGALAVGVSFLLKEKTRAPKTFDTFSFFVFINYWKQSSAVYKKLTGALLLFALINSSDVFLLLKMKSSGCPDTTIIGIYIFYNAAYALLAYPVGIFADRTGLKKTLVSGLIIFAVAYALMSATNSIGGFIVVFLLYGLYAAATEGIARAYISNVVDNSETATAIGTFSGFQSIASLFASTLAGLIWFNLGSTIVFVIAAIVAVLSALYIYWKV